MSLIINCLFFLLIGILHEFCIIDPIPKALEIIITIVAIYTVCELGYAMWYMTKKKDKK